MSDSLSGPFSPDNFRQGITGGQTGQTRHLLPHPAGDVLQLLDLGLDDDGEGGRGLQPPGVVLSDAAVIPGVFPLRIEQCHCPGVLVHFGSYFAKYFIYFLIFSKCEIIENLLFQKC